MNKPLILNTCSSVCPISLLCILHTKCSENICLKDGMYAYIVICVKPDINKVGWNFPRASICIEPLMKYSYGPVTTLYFWYSEEIRLCINDECSKFTIFLSGFWHSTLFGANLIICSCYMPMEEDYATEITYYPNTANIPAVHYTEWQNSYVSIWFGLKVDILRVPRSWLLSQIITIKLWKVTDGNRNRIRNIKLW